MVQSSLQGYSIVGDLMDVSDAKRTIDEAVEKMGGLDILVNTDSGIQTFMHPFTAYPSDQRPSCADCCS